MAGPAVTPPEAESVRVARSAGMMSAAIALSRVAGMFREIVLAREFGAGMVFDAFLLGFRIPNLGRDVFAEGALTSAFIPVFTNTLQREGREEAERLANLVTTAILVVVGLVCAVAAVFAPEIVRLVAPGFAAVPAKFALSVKLTRIMLPFLLLISLSAAMGGILNSCGSFGIPAVSAVFFNLGSVGVGTALGFWIGPRIGLSAIAGMAYGMVIGGALQFLSQVPKARSLGFRQRFAFDWNHPGLRKVVRLLGPGLIASAALQLNIIINTAFASGVNDPVRGHNGPVSWLTYALRFVQLPLALFGISFASAVLPSVSRSVEHRDFVQFRRTISESLAVVFVLTIPSSLMLIIFCRPIVGAIYQGGRFDAYDTQQTALALAFYATGLIGYAANRLLSPVFYALSDARTPMYVSLFSVALNVLFPLFFLRYLHAGFWSLALTTALAIGIESVLLLELLRRKLGGIDGRFLFDRLMRVLFVSVFVGALMLSIYTGFQKVLGVSRIAYLIELAACFPLATLAFGAGFRIMRVPETEIAFEAFRSPIRKLLRRAR